MKDIFILLFALVVLPGLGQGANYYFSSSTGNDSRSFAQAQNPATPWKSLEKLNAIFPQLQAGDSILFKRDDIFFGSITLRKSGSEFRPIVLSAYGSGNLPTISGFHEITNWTSLGGGIYRSEALPTGSRLHMLSINGQNYPMGRYPNADADNQGYLTFESSRNNLIIDSELPSQPNWTNAEIVIRSSRFTLDRTKVLDHSGNQIQFNPDALSYTLLEGYGYFLQNDIKTLDQFGEWYYDAATRRVYLYSGNQSPQNYQVQVSAIDILFDAKASHIVIEHLRIEGANEFAFFNENAGTRNFAIRYCEIDLIGKNAVRFSGRNRFQMEHSTVSNINTSGIELIFQNPNAIIRNNNFQNIGLFPGMLSENQSYAIAGYSEGFIVENNTIINIGYIGIRFDGSNVLVKNNYIDSFCTTLDDGGGIYTYRGDDSEDFTNRQIIKNIVINGIGAGSGTNLSKYQAVEGIYIDDNVKNVEIDGNTVANCGNNGIKIHNSQDFIVRNNTFFNNAIQFATLNDQLQWSVSGGIIENNIFFSKEAHQLTASLWSIQNEIQEIGSFQNNYYVRPLDDKLTIQTRYLKNNSIDMRQWFQLENWQDQFNEDLNSQRSPIDLTPYKIESIHPTNKILNGRFNSHTKGSYCWSPDNGCQISWKVKSEMDGGCLQTSGLGPAYIIIGAGTVANSKRYLLRVSTLSEKEGSIEVFLRQSGWPYENISKTKAIKIKPERQNHELLFSFPESEFNSSIVIYSGNENVTFWLDNIELHEVEATMTNPEDFILFEYNPSQSVKKVSLNGRYLDVQNNSFEGELNLQAFESVILIKDTANITVLPVKLTRFQSKLVDCNIQIEWTAHSESNFSHYILEKSLDGKRFEALSKIPGIISSGEHNYSFVDKSPRSMNYYRLKMVDLDSTFSYSDVIVSASDCSGVNYNWLIYPTLLNGQNTQLSSRIYTQRDSLTISVFDQTGRTVKTFETPMQKGWNDVKWNMEDLAPGLYFIHNPDALSNKTIRFVVME